MASLDHDLKNLRLSKYTPQMSAMVRSWMSSTLNETLPDKDLMDLLKDGTLLCRLANLLAERPIKFKTSNMPFVQRENISNFLSFISSPPVSLAPHDRFLTVDLFDRKDPAQVVQCLSAFSRAAHMVDPEKFPETIGGLKGGVLSPSSPNPSGARSPVFPKSPVLPVSPQFSTPKNEVVTAWTKKDQEFTTTPAWNIVQYGYMGGASQNQGISFGARRQITQTPVISDFDKRRATEREEREKLRKQQAQEAEELRKQQDELKAREEEVKRKRDEDRRREQIERDAKEREEEGERLRRLNHVESAAKARQEREREVQAQRREKELREAREEAERREKRDREIQDQRRREQLAQAELREAREEAARRQRYADQLAADRLADLAARKKLEADEALESDIDDSVRIAAHRLQKVQDMDPLTRERERVKQLEKQLAEAREREKMYLAARAELVWDPTGRVTLQDPTVKDSPEEEVDQYNLEIPKRKLPTPPSKGEEQQPITMWLETESIERKKSWEEGDDKKPLDSPTKKQAPPLKWQRPQSRGRVTKEPEQPAVRYQYQTANTARSPSPMRKPLTAMTFLERERERERLRQKEWEKEHMSGV